MRMYWYDTHTHMYTCIFIYITVCIGMIHTCIYIYIYIYTHTHIWVSYYTIVKVIFNIPFYNCIIAYSRLRPSKCNYAIQFSDIICMYCLCLFDIIFKAYACVPKQGALYNTRRVITLLRGLWYLCIYFLHIRRACDTQTNNLQTYITHTVYSLKTHVHRIVTAYIKLILLSYMTVIKLHMCYV